VSNLTGVTAIAAGSNHSPALTSNGTVRAWGKNHYGQLGGASSGVRGSSSCSLTPLAVDGVTGATAVAGGEWHSLAATSATGTTTTSTTYGYDRLDRLTGDGARSYAYDPVGAASPFP
jgi:alpha-tubulin suppressor-like RCC1 family protein